VAGLARRMSLGSFFQEVEFPASLHAFGFCSRTATLRFGVTEMFTDGLFLTLGAFCVQVHPLFISCMFAYVICFPFKFMQCSHLNMVA
jgi:hypothetical protein